MLHRPCFSPLFLAVADLQVIWNVMFLAFIMVLSSALLLIPFMLWGLVSACHSYPDTCCKRIR